MQGLLMLKGIYIKKDQREFLCAKIQKISIVNYKCNLVWKHFDA